MKMSPDHKFRHFLFCYSLSAVFLLLPAISLAGNSAPFVKKIQIVGNTLIDPFDLNNYLDLGNGLNMTPEIMDMAVSELKANYDYHGYPFINAYSTLKVKNGVMTIKVDEKDEYRWGKPRAERATLKQAFLHNMTLKDSKKQKIIKTLVKGYQKEKLNEEVVANFLMQKQKKRIEGIHSQRRASLREKIFAQVKEFQTTKKNIETAEIKRIEEMRGRIESTLIKKYADSATEAPQLVSDEYTNLDEFLDNTLFEEMLNPGL
jgi:hypothetical protein